MATKIEIVNIALGLIGANLITSLQDDSDEARLVNTHYDVARDATLEAHPWTFALKRFEPNADADAPLFGWANAFIVPSEIVRVVSCDRIGPVPSGRGQNTYSPEQIDWQLERRRIMTNEAKVYAVGVERISNEGDYTNLFVHAFSAKLAMLISLPLTQSSKIFESMAILYENFMAEAKSRDGIQGRTRRIRQQSLDRAR